MPDMGLISKSERIHFVLFDLTKGVLPIWNLLILVSYLKFIIIGVLFDINNIGVLYEIYY